MCDLDFLLENDVAGPIYVGDRVRVGNRKKSAKSPHNLAHYKEGDKGTVTEVPTKLPFDDKIIYVRMDMDGRVEGFYYDRMTVIKS